MPKNQVPDREILEAALVGLQQSLTDVDARMAEIRRKLGIRRRSPAAAALPAEAPRKRTLTAAARRRIAAAQKKRWDTYRKNQQK